MTVQANKVKHIFAPIKGKQLGALSWDPPPDPPGVLKRKAAEQAAAEYSKKPCTLPPPPPLPAQPDSQPQSDSVPYSNLPSGEASALAGPERTDAQQSKQQQQQQRGKAGIRADSRVCVQDASQGSDVVDIQEADVQPESSSSSDAGVVDFMSDDDDDAETAQGPPMQDLDHVSSRRDNAQPSTHAKVVATRHEATDLSRFGSDSEGDGDTSQPAGTAAISGVAMGTDLSRFDSDDEQFPLAADGFGADTTAPQQATVPVNASKRITDLSEFDSEDEQANSPDAGAGVVTSAAQRRGAVAAGSEARDTDLSRFDSGDDSSEDGDKPAGEMTCTSMAAIRRTPDLMAMHTQPLAK